VTTYPEIVHSYEEFDDSQPFEAIRLVGAISDPAEFDEDTHGKLTAIVRYHMPYTDRDSSPTALCIALGSDVAVNTILGFPTITDFEIELRLRSPRSFYSSVLDHTFTFSQSEAKSGLPGGVEFNHELDFVRVAEPAFPAKSNRRPSSRSAPAKTMASPSPKPVPSAEPTTTLAVSLPSISGPFNPSRQMQEMCRQMNAHLASIDAAPPPNPVPPS
jgi:hypothetical protein